MLAEDRALLLSSGHLWSGFAVPGSNYGQKSALYLNDGKGKLSAAASSAATAGTESTFAVAWSASRRPPQNSASAPCSASQEDLTRISRGDSKVLSTPSQPLNLSTSQPLNLSTSQLEKAYLSLCASLTQQEMLTSFLRFPPRPLKINKINGRTTIGGGVFCFVFAPSVGF